MLWFLKGCTHTNYLSQNGVKTWDGYSSREFLDDNGFKKYKEGDLGPIYGYQWRNWGGNKRKKGFDQINNIITSLKSGDYSSNKLILSSWNVSELHKMVSTPSHCFCQFYMSDKGLCCALTQISSNIFVELPLNIASYALLTRMIAHVTRLKTDKLVINLGDNHIYEHNVHQCKYQLSQNTRNFPELYITNQTDDIDELTYDDFILKGYI
jgi:thymidylate synthase